MLIIEIAKIELCGGHIGIKLIIEMARIEINRRPYWIYYIYIHYQNEIGFMISTKIKYW